jgi:hypothetical protein
MSSLQVVVQLLNGSILLVYVELEKITIVFENMPRRITKKYRAPRIDTKNAPSKDLILNGSVIAQSVAWENPNPFHGSVTIREYLPTGILDRQSPRFSDDKSPQGGDLGDPRGIEMESGRMINEHPYRSRLEE